MKLKYFLRFVGTIVLFTMLSCSENDDDPIIVLPSENYSLVTKVTEITHYSATDFDSTFTYFTYEDRKLKNTFTFTPIATYESDFHYDGNKVTSVYYSKNGTYTGQTNFFYEGDFLTHTFSGISQNERTDYFYTNGYPTTVKSYLLDGSNETLLESETYTFASGNATKVLKQDYWNSEPSTSRTEYTYDAKKNPLRGINRYLKMTISTEGFDGLSVNNPIAKASYFPSDSATPSLFYYEMIYNGQDYPTEIKRFNTETNFLISETKIEYQ